MADASQNNDQDSKYYDEIKKTFSSPGAAGAKKLFVDKLGNEEFEKFISYIKYPPYLRKELKEMSKTSSDKFLAGYFLESFLEFLDDSESKTTIFLEALEIMDCHDVAIKFCPSFVYQKPKDDVSTETKNNKRKTKDNTAQSGKKSKRRV